MLESTILLDTYYSQAFPIRKRVDEIDHHVFLNDQYNQILELAQGMKKYLQEF
jgi:hypothetical protein